MSLSLINVDHDLSPTASNSVSSYDNIEDANEDAICQLDGIDDQATSIYPSTSLSAANTAGNVRRASYNLNRNKQLSKLTSDSLINDFEIVVSPNEQNVNIICSTGFYSLVALPAFSHIAVGYSRVVAGVSVYCHDIIGKHDGTDAKVNTLYQFRLHAPDKSTIGGVAIHLHHYVRKVQVQGGSMVDEQTRAGVWFVDNIIRETFAAMSQNQAMDISNFNSAVQGMVRKHNQKNSAQEKCKTCNGHFTGRSLREQCLKCNNHFHKKCFPSRDHPCASSGKSLPGTSSLNSANRAQHQRSEFPSNGHLSQHPHAPTGSIVPPPAPLLLSTSPTPCLPLSSSGHRELEEVSSLPVLSAALYDPFAISAGTNAVHSVLDPAAPPFCDLPGPSRGHQTSARLPKTKSKGALATSKEGIELEFANVQIRTMQAKLKDHDTTIKELKFQNKILLERVAIFEKAENTAIYERYFPHPDQQQKTTQSCQSDSPRTAPAPPDTQPACTSQVRAPPICCQVSCCHYVSHCCKPCQTLLLV